MTTATVIKSMTGRILYQEIQRIPQKQYPQFTPQQEKKINKKNSTSVNMTYVMAFIIESIATDIKHQRLINLSSRMRERINETSEQTSNDFGDWSDFVESKIMKLGDRREILYIICDKIHRLSKQMEQTYRQFNPYFDFYQVNETKQLQSYTKGKRLNTELYKDINSVIDKIKKS